MDFSAFPVLSAGTAGLQPATGAGTLAGSRREAAAGPVPRVCRGPAEGSPWTGVPGRAGQRGGVSGQHRNPGGGDAPRQIAGCGGSQAVALRHPLSVSAWEPEVPGVAEPDIFVLLCS